jgi:hypothetical protein
MDFLGFIPEIMPLNKIKKLIVDYHFFLIKISQFFMVSREYELNLKTMLLFNLFKIKYYGQTCNTIQRTMGRSTC